MNTDEEEIFISTQEANNTADDGQQNGDIITRALRASDVNDAAYAVSSGSDVIHGTLRLHPSCNAFRNTPQFQRLAGLKQLGVTNLVPDRSGAEHSRLVHSLGVSHLALRLLEGLQERSREDLQLTERDIRNVALAGLCHDLGHGPLSHVFEKEFTRKMKKSWSHEAMSIKMLTQLIKDNGISDVDEDDITFIEKLIQGVHPKDRPAGSRRFLYDIISNDYNGIDVDRMDYLQRDAVHCGVGLTCDFNQLLDTAEVVGDQICYPLSQAANVWAVFRERVRMFQQVYTHWRTKAVEFMAVDALVEAEDALKVSSLIDDAETFQVLDDSLLKTIAGYKVLHRGAWDMLTPRQRDSLQGAQELLRRLHRGNPYPCCGVCEVPADILLHEKKEAALVADFTVEKMLESSDEDTVAAGGLTAQDVILDLNKIDYAKGGGDPMAKVGFFDDQDDSEGPRRKVQLNEEQLAELPGRPSCFRIRTLRVYVRDHKHREAASAAFHNWCREYLPGGAVVEDVEAAEAGTVAVARAATIVTSSTRSLPPCKRGEEGVAADSDAPPMTPLKVPRRALPSSPSNT